MPVFSGDGTDMAGIRERPTARNGRQLINEIVVMIQKKSVEDLTALKRKSIADWLGKNESWLSREFKKHTGMLLHHYIDFIKMYWAERLLKERQDLSIEEISHLIGIRKAENFRKNFKKIYGLNPFRYRFIHKK